MFTHLVVLFTQHHLESRDHYFLLVLHCFTCKTEMYLYFQKYLYLYKYLYFPQVLYVLAPLQVYIPRQVSVYTCTSKSTLYKYLQCTSTLKIQLNFDISNTEYNGYVEVVCNYRPLFKNLFYPLYLEYLYISKFLNSLIQFKLTKFDCTCISLTQIILLSQYPHAKI